MPFSHKKMNLVLTNIHRDVASASATSYSVASVASASVASVSVAIASAAKTATQIAKKTAAVALKNKVFSIQYNEPAEKKMAVILVYFNIQQSIRLIHNLLYVKNLFDLAKIPYFIGEMSIQGSPFLFPESANIFHFKSDDIMFYKENLINIMEPLIPSEYTKLCMMDADILFDNPRWYALMSAKLNVVNICQPFSEACWLNISYNEILRSTASYLKNRNGGHEGFVWGFQRDWFNKYKFPCGFIGGGDTIFVYAVLNKTIFKSHEYMRSILTTYIDNLPKNISADYLNLKIYHLYHGTIANRQYVSRHAKINNLLESLNNININECMEYNTEGIMKWKASVRDTFNPFIKEYLLHRDDDSI